MIDPRPTALTLFSGGGLAALGLQQAGYRVVGGVEYDPAIAAVYADNLGPVDVVDLTAVPARYFAQWRGVDLLQASPPCVSFSAAKQRGYETRIDVRLGGAVCRALRVIRPRVFVLENVRGYVDSASYTRILATLTTLGYTVHAAVLNAADWGVPQSRHRLILRAVRDGGALPALAPTHSATGDWWTEPWVGWYAAIADLLPTLRASAFAPWQRVRLERMTPPPVFLLDGRDGGGVPRPPTRPAATVQAYTQLAQAPRVCLGAAGGSHAGQAFLMAQSKDKYGDGLRYAPEPSHTLSVQATTHPLRAWLESGVVVQLSERALARLQGVPDTYRLPARTNLACRILGNGVPPPLMAALAAQFVGGA